MMLKLNNLKSQLDNHDTTQATQRKGNLSERQFNNFNTLKSENLINSSRKFNGYFYNKGYEPPIKVTNVWDNQLHQQFVKPPVKGSRPFTARIMSSASPSTNFIKLVHAPPQELAVTSRSPTSEQQNNITQEIKKSLYIIKREIKSSYKNSNLNKKNQHQEPDENYQRKLTERKFLNKVSLEELKEKANYMNISEMMKRNKKYIDSKNIKKIFFLGNN